MILIFLLIPATGALAREIAVIEIRHRPAEDLVPMVRMLLNPGDAVVPNGNQLIIKADRAGIAEVRAVLGQLDQPLRRLLITVSRSDRVAAEGWGAGGGGRVGPDGIRVYGGISGYRGSDRDDGLQQVQTLDGQTALIQAGNLVPVPDGFGGLHYQPVTEGFSVTPRVSGDRVTVDIAPWADRIGQPGSAGISTQGAATQVTGRLGEWIAIGGVTHSFDGAEGGLPGQGQWSRSGESRLFVKVEDLNTTGR